MSKSTLIFDKYLGYNIGGAERSLHTLIGQMSAPYFLLGCKISKMIDIASKEIDLPVERFACIELVRFPYIEYLINRRRVARSIAHAAPETLIAQGLWAPAAFQGARDATRVLFIRSEYQINQIPFFHMSWWKKVLKLGYLLIQLPGVLCLFRDNKRALKSADMVIANSVYMQRRIWEKFGIHTELVYPMRDVQRLIGEQIDATAPYITLVGSEKTKGIEVFRAIAANMPERRFLVVGKNIQSEHTVGNITYTPWVDDPMVIYRQTKVLLVPSLWAESSPGVIVEAMALGIPVIASDRGGISELIYADGLIQNPYDIDSWIAKIRAYLTQLPVAQIEVGRTRAQTFDYRIQSAICKAMFEQQLGITL